MECDIPNQNVSELSIVFTDNKDIQKLNSEYRGKDKATDVLSFPQLSDSTSGLIVSLGDIVISEEYAKRQAQELSVSFEEEVLRLLIHGVLHLLGYEHENVSSEEASKMFNLQDSLWMSYRPALGS